jgi:hypothetical protein
MLTRTEIAAEATTLTPEEQALWLTLFRSYPGYSLATHPEAAEKLGDVEGVEAQQLLAALRKIEEIGAGTIRLEGGRDALDYDQRRDRYELIAYGLSVLFETSEEVISVPAFMVVE